MKKAFTLIELLVVIAIIGILAALIILNLSSSRAKARNARRKSDLASIQTALELYNDTNNAYPVAAAGVYSYPLNTSWIPGLTPTYATKVPTDPTNNATPYRYEYKTDATGGYKLCAKLENDSASESGDGGLYPSSGITVSYYEVFGGTGQNITCSL